MKIERSDLKRLAVFCLAGALFAVAVWLPAHRERDQLHQRIEAARTKLGVDLEQTQHLPDLHERVETLRETLAGEQRYVPQEDELDQLLRDLTEAMNAHAVIDPELVVADTRRLSGYSVVSMRIRFRGSFRATFGVLERIESMSRLVRIDELEMTPDRQSEGASPLMVTLKLSTFFAQDQSGDGADDQEGGT